MPNRVIETYGAWLSSGLTLPPGDGDGPAFFVFDRKGRTCRSGGDIDRARDEQAFPLTFVPADQVEGALGMALARIAVLERWCGLNSGSAYLIRQAEWALEVQARACEAQRDRVLARMEAASVG